MERSITLRRFAATAAATAVLLALQVVGWSPLATDSAQAVPGWPQPLASLHANEVVTHPDGSVSAFDCSSPQNTAAQTFNAGGTVLTTVGQNHVFCNDWQGAAGPDGSIYGTKYSTNGRIDVVGYKNNALKWPAVQLTACTGQWADTAGMTIGSDGHLYVVAYSANCGGQYYLFGINTTNGTQKFTKKTLGTAVAPSGGPYYGYVAAYSGGLIVRYGNATFRYFNNTGTETTAKKYTFSLATSEYLGTWSVNHQGSLFVTVGDVNYSRPAPCTEPNILKRVVRRTLAGANLTYNTAGVCTYANWIRVTPNGGAVIPRELNYPIASSYDPNTSLLVLQPGGTITAVTVPAPAGYTVVGDGSGQTTVLVDTAGNIVYTRRLGEGGDVYVQTSLLNPGGSSMANFITKPFGDPNATDTHFRQYGGVAISNGYVFLALCNYQFCSGPGTQQLHKLSFAEVGFDYPRGTLFGTPAPQPTMDYVALGDSFSAGEGVEPFLSGTDTSGPPENRCHRSEKAYAELLAQNPAVPLYLQGFRACSGATTEDVTNDQADTDPGQWHENRQTLVLNSSTDVVTLSIGGNNISFDAFVTQCLFVDCSASAVKQPFFDEISQLSTSLSGTYSAVLGAAQNADLYVIGYPQLLPNADCLQTEGWMQTFNGLVQTAHDYPQLPNGMAARAAVYAVSAFAGFTSQQAEDLIATRVVEFNMAEVQTARDLVVQLNQKIDDVVGTQNPRLHFVDPTVSTSPFVGHELCTPEPYFNGLDVFHLPPHVVNIEYSFHPNAEGQAAYASLIGWEQF